MANKTDRSVSTVKSSFEVSPRTNEKKANAFKLTGQGVQTITPWPCASPTVKGEATEASKAVENIPEGRRGILKGSSHANKEVNGASKLNLNSQLSGKSVMEMSRIFEEYSKVQETFRDTTKACDDILEHYGRQFYGSSNENKNRNNKSMVPRRKMDELKRTLDDSPDHHGKEKDASILTDKSVKEKMALFDGPSIVKEKSTDMSKQTGLAVKEKRTVLDDSSNVIETTKDTSKTMLPSSVEVPSRKTEEINKILEDTPDHNEKGKDASKRPWPEVKALKTIFDDSSIVKEETQSVKMRKKIERSIDINKEKNGVFQEGVMLRAKSEPSLTSESAFCYPLILFGRECLIKGDFRWLKRFFQPGERGQIPYFVLFSYSKMAKHAEKAAANILSCMKRLSFQRDRESAQFPPHSEDDAPGIYLWHTALQIQISRIKVPVIYMTRRGSDLSHDERKQLLGFAVAVSDLLVYSFHRRITGDDITTLGEAIDYPPTESFMKRKQKLLILVLDWIDPQRFSYGPEGGRKYMIHILTLPNMNDKDSLARKRILTAYGLPDCILVKRHTFSKEQSTDQNYEDLYVRQALSSFASNRAPSEDDALKRIEDIILKIRSYVHLLSLDRKKLI